jgi:hypothetical protein
VYFLAHAQIQVADKPMQVVGVYAQQLGGFGEAAAGLLEG